MPQVRKKDETIEVTLPSYGTEDAAIVVVRKNTATSDIVTVDDTLSEKEKALALLTNLIVSWNLTDEGKPVPINEATVGALDIQDFIVLIGAINTGENKELSDQKKSNS